MRKAKFTTHLQNKKTRNGYVCIGTFESPKATARAYDILAFNKFGKERKFNFLKYVPMHQGESLRVPIQGEPKLIEGATIQCEPKLIGETIVQDELELIGGIIVQGEPKLIGRATIQGELELIGGATVQGEPKLMEGPLILSMITCEESYWRHSS